MSGRGYTPSVREQFIPGRADAEFTGEYVTPHQHVTSEHAHEGDTVSTHTHWLPHSHEGGEVRHDHPDLSDYRTA